GTREELVADLTQEARELTDLVNELVELAAGQSDTEPPRRVDLADVAQEVAAHARRRSGRRILVAASGDTTTDGRPGMLTRAVSNLVENAVKFDRNGRAPIEIDVAATARPGTVRVEVRDRGPGITDEDLLHVFDRFYRAADARSLPGSGLGLSIVREVALAHGGLPHAARREGGGTVIGFTVGGVAEEGTRAEEAPRPGGTHAGGDGWAAGTRERWGQSMRAAGWLPGTRRDAGATDESGAPRVSPASTATPPRTTPTADDTHRGRRAPRTTPTVDDIREDPAMSTEQTPRTGPFSYALTRTLDAPAETVWRAWTTPDEYARWAYAVPGSVEMDVRPGGAWKATVATPDGDRV